MLEAVLFDWGDTLMRHEWNDEVAAAGNRTGLAALGRADLPRPEAIGEWFSAHLGSGEEPEDEVRWDDLVAACFAELGCRLDDDDLRLYMRASYAYWESTYEVPSEVHELLDALRANGLRLAIVSNTIQPEWILRPVFERQGLAARVDAIVLSSEVGKRKPHRAIFDRAVEELGTRPERCLFVGDRLYNDVRGAFALGMSTVQALWFRADEHANGADPDFRAHAPADVLEAARRLASRP